MKHTIAEARKLNAEKGHYFFSRDTMRFLKSRVESTILKGEYFITSEQLDLFERGNPRRYKIRRINWETGNISTEPGSYRTKDAAKDALNDALKGLPQYSLEQSIKRLLAA